MMEHFILNIIKYYNESVFKNIYKNKLIIPNIPRNGLTTIKTDPVFMTYVGLIKISLKIDRYF